MGDVHLVLSFVVLGIFATTGNELHPDTGLSTVRLVEKYGYPLESHEVQTQDGYLLTMHRIPHGINDPYPASQRPAVLIMHGLTSSSADWVNMGPQKAIAFLLADAGFDVWLGNQRGNTWSRKHVSLDPDENPAEFFDFSWHEIGTYDLPAKIDHILATTGETSLSYIGHSQGTTSFFVMTSERPEYNEKIRLMIALAPVVYMTNIPNPFGRILADKLHMVQRWLHDAKIFEILRHSDFITFLGSTLCAEGSRYQELCVAVLFLTGGLDSPQLDRQFLSVILTSTPAGAAIKQVIHYLQQIKARKFSQFDYGLHGNMEKYGQETPPFYDLSKVTAPVILHYSENDWLTSPYDVEKLYWELPSVALKMVPLREFNHLDFLWAIDINELLNNQVVAEMRQKNFHPPPKFF